MMTYAEMANANRHAPEEPERVLELTGAKSVTELVEWFGGMNDEEIARICDDIWPDEDNMELAGRVSSVVADADEIRANWPLYYS